MAGHDAVVHFAAESHVDRSIAGPDDFINTNCFGTNIVMDTARRLEIEPRRAHRHRRGVRLGRGRLVEGDRPARAALAVLGVEGRLRPHRALVPPHLRPAGRRSRAARTTSGRSSTPRRRSRCSPPTCSTASRSRSTATASTSATGSTSTTTAPACSSCSHEGAPGEIYNIGAGNETPNRVLVDKLLALARRGRGDGRVRRPTGSATTAATRSTSPRSPRSAGASSARSTRRSRRRSTWYRDNRWWWEPLKARAVKVLVTGAGGQVGRELRRRCCAPRRRGRSRADHADARRRRPRRGARRRSRAAGPTRSSTARRGPRSTRARPIPTARSASTRSAPPHRRGGAPGRRARRATSRPTTCSTATKADAVRRVGHAEPAVGVRPLEARRRARGRRPGRARSCALVGVRAARRQHGEDDPAAPQPGGARPCRAGQSAIAASTSERFAL